MFIVIAKANPFFFFFFQNKLFSFVETHPAFKHHVGQLTMDQERRRCVAQIRALINNDVLVRMTILYFLVLM